MQTLTERSSRSRELHYTGKTIGERREESRETRQIVALVRRAVSMAAGERERHGRVCREEDRQDAAAEVLADLYAKNGRPNCAVCGKRADGISGATDATEELPRCSDCAESTAGSWAPYPPTSPRLADLTGDDPMPTGDGSQLVDRPSRDLIASAGSALDRMRHDREAELSDSLYAASVETRAASETRRRSDSQLVDPTADPMPPEVSDALDAANVWPTDPLRIAVGDQVSSLPITSGDWIVTGYGTGKTASYIRTALQRGRKRLALGSLDSTVSAFGSALRDKIEPTEEEHLAAAERGRESLLATEGIAPHLPRQSRSGIVPTATVGAWRTLQAVRRDHGERNAGRARRPIGGPKPSDRPRVQPAAPAPVATRRPGRRGDQVTTYLARWL